MDTIVTASRARRMSIPLARAHVHGTRSVRTPRARTTRANVDGPVRARGPVSSRVPGTPSSVSRGRPPRRRRSVAATKDAVGSSGEEFSSDMPPRKRRSVVLSAVNESTKFVVSLAALATLLRDPSVETCWALLGSIVNSVNGKILKRVLNHARPIGAVKADPGMPSSHATSLSYLSVYGAAALTHFRDVIPAIGYGGQLVVSAGLVALGVFLSYLRVSTGYHTPPQVIVGYGVGSTTALAWLFVGLKYVKPLLDANPEMLSVLHSLLIIAIGWFVITALDWVEGLVRRVKRRVFNR